MQLVPLLVPVQQLGEVLVSKARKSQAGLLLVSKVTASRFAPVRRGSLATGSLTEVCNPVEMLMLMLTLTLTLMLM